MHLTRGKRGLVELDDRELGQATGGGIGALLLGGGLLLGGLAALFGLRRQDLVRAQPSCCGFRTGIPIVHNPGVSINISFKESRPSYAWPHGTRSSSRNT
jgi:hypothetical protein